MVRISNYQQPVFKLHSQLPSRPLSSDVAIANEILCKFRVYPWICYYRLLYVEICMMCMYVFNLCAVVGPIYGTEITNKRTSTAESNMISIQLVRSA